MKRGVDSKLSQVNILDLGLSTTEHTSCGVGVGDGGERGQGWAPSCPGEGISINTAENPAVEERECCRRCSLAVVQCTHTHASHPFSSTAKTSTHSSSHLPGMQCRLVNNTRERTCTHPSLHNRCVRLYLRMLVATFDREVHNEQCR